MTDHAARVREAREALWNLLPRAMSAATGSRITAATRALVTAAEAKGRAEAVAEAVRIVEGCKRYRGIKQSIQRNGDMVRWTWWPDEKRHRYCDNVLDRNEVIAALRGTTEEET